MQLYYPTLTIAALIVWGIGNAYSLKKLQKMQNRAARVITGKSYDVRSKDILQELSWQPLMGNWGNNVLCNL